MTMRSEGRPEPFRIELDSHGETIVVHVWGEIDVATNPELERQLRELLERGFGRVVLDLRQVSFIDSSGLRIVLDAKRASRDAGLDFAVLPGPPSVQRLLEITGSNRELRFIEPADIDRPWS